MRLGNVLVVIVCVGGIAGCSTSSAAPEPSPAGAAAGSPAAGRLPVEILGRTQCLLKRKAVIAPVVLHPVVEVLVAPGDRVKKGQALVKIDDDEPQADVRHKQACLESCKVNQAEAERYLAQSEKTYAQGAFPEQRLHEARAAALKTSSDARAAQAALESARAELEHYVVNAEIDGVISKLSVHPGMVSRPGTTVWGEIVDVRELDVRCELTPAQADAAAIGQGAEVLRETGGDERWAGKVVFIGPEADGHTGTVPVLVRIANPDCRLRANVTVKVRFGNQAAAER